MKAILAADENYAIGKDGQLLAYIKDDLQFFKENTLNKTVILGRKTLYTFPGQKPLPKRNNIVMSRDKNFFVEGATIVHSLEEVFDCIKNIPSDDVFIIGGAEIYRLFLPYIDEIILTKIYKKFANVDAYFPNIEQSGEFELIWSSEKQKFDDIEFTFNRYKRKK